MIITVSKNNENWEVIEEPAIFGNLFPTKEGAVNYAKTIVSNNTDPNTTYNTRVEQPDGYYKILT